MLSTTGKLENRIPLSIRSRAGKLDWSGTWRDTLGFVLPLPEDEIPAARAVAAAAAAATEDLDAERPDECFGAPVVLDMEALREGGFAPGGSGFFLGGAMISPQGNSNACERN